MQSYNCNKSNRWSSDGHIATAERLTLVYYSLLISYPATPQKRSISHSGARQSAVAAAYSRLD